MVFVRHEPPPVYLPQPDGEAQTVLSIRSQFLLSAAAQQRVREGDVFARGDFERDDLERSALLLPLEERRPRLTIGVDAPHAIVGWRNIEHHDVVGVIGQDTIHVTLVHRPRPTLDQCSDLRLVVPHGLSSPFNDAAPLRTYIRMCAKYGPRPRPELIAVSPTLGGDPLRRPRRSERLGVADTNRFVWLKKPPSYTGWAAQRDPGERWFLFIQAVKAALIVGLPWLGWAL